jgi:hypothetical protein
MTVLLENLFQQYATRGMLVDTNILLLYCVGSCDRKLIGWKRLAAFTLLDFELLLRVWPLFAKIVTTPNILTEVNSLAGQLGGTDKERCFQKFAEQITTLEELHTPSRDLAEADHFPRFGLTDSGIVNLAAGRFLVLTDDFRLWGFLSKRNIDVVNFNHLRELAGSLRRSAPVNGGAKRRSPRSGRANPPGD